MPITGRSGQAIAAPSAIGSPSPIAPPVSASQSCRGAPEVSSCRPDAGGQRLVDDDRVLGQQRADDGVHRPRRQLPGRQLGPGRLQHLGRRRRARPARPAPRSAATPSSPGSLSTCTVQSSGTGWPGTSGIAEEVHRRLRAGEHQVLRAGQRGDRHLRRVRQPGDVGQPGAPGGPRAGRSPSAAGRRCRRRSGRRRAGPPPPSTSPPRKSTVGSPEASTAATSSITDGATCGAGRTGSGAADLGAVLPRHVGRAGSAWRSARVPRRRRDRLGGVGRDVGGRQRPPHPAGDRAGDGVDVGLQRRVEPLVRARVVADDVDQRRARRGGRCAGWPARCPCPARGAAASRRGARPCARTRRPRRWPRPRTG